MCLSTAWRNNSPTCQTENIQSSEDLNANAVKSKQEIFQFDITYIKTVRPDLDLCNKNLPLDTHRKI